MEALMSLEIRPLAAGDRQAWETALARLPDLLQGCARGPCHETTWVPVSRSCETGSGLGCLRRQKTLLGIVHCVVHRTTWSTKDICYLRTCSRAEARGKGVGRALIEHVYATARERKLDQGLLADA